MKTKRILHILGAAWGIGSPVAGSEWGPKVLRDSAYWAPLREEGLEPYWEEIISIAPLSEKASLLIAEACQRIAKYTQAFSRLKQLFMVVGGDNTCSVGTWSGAHSAICDRGALGLIWIDAHLDSHTPDTTESGALHGMPLAALLGYGDPLFTQMVHADPKLLPQNVCIIGARSYEIGEYELLKRLGVHIFFADEVHEKGIDVIFQEALNIVRAHTVNYGICIDLDAIDPKEAPGVGSPEANGLASESLCAALTTVAADPKLMGFEIVEFNPSLDREQITEKVICQLTQALSL